MPSNQFPEYGETCRTVATDFVERSTRFGALDLATSESVSKICNLSILVRHSLEVISRDYDVSGKEQPSESDYSTSDWEHYKEQVLAQAQTELRRSATLDELVAQVSDAPYGKTAERTTLRVHPSRLLHPYTCSTCSGTGRISCSNCSGSGNVTCYGCGGGGKVNCSSCGGSGTHAETHQVRDFNGHYHSETRHRPCYSCAGGRVSCRSCGGDGRITCSSCGGTGKVNCTTCGATGWLTRITETTTYTTPVFECEFDAQSPDWLRTELMKVGLHNLGRFGPTQLIHVKTSPEHAQAEFRFEISIPYAELKVAINGHQSTFHLYGETPVIQDAGQLLERLLSEDFKDLSKIGSSFTRMLPWFQNRSQPILVRFMESEIHQDLLKADCDGFSHDEITNKLGQAFSSQYVTTSLFRLQQIVGTNLFWLRVKFIIGSALLSVFLTYLLVILTERSKTHSMLSTQELLGLGPFGQFPVTFWSVLMVALPISLISWVIADWFNNRALALSGGPALLSWASAKKFKVGTLTTIMAIGLGAFAAHATSTRWPAWMDKEGRLFGKFALFQPAEIVEPTIERTKSVFKKPAQSSPKKTKQNTDRSF